MLRSIARTLVLLAAAALTGCDDLLTFDVASDGKLLVAFDVGGRAAAIGDGSAPRHLAHVDAVTGEVARLTEAPFAFAWPRACGEGAVVVQERRTLVLVGAGGARRVLLESSRRLLQPTPSPACDRVAVLQSDKLGAPGTLLVLDVRDGSELARLEGALLGFAWRSDGALIAPRATTEREKPLEVGPGELVLLRGDAESSVTANVASLGKGPLGPATWIAPRPGSEDAAVVLPRGEPASPTFSVSRVGPSGARRGAAPGTLDLWPCVDARGRVLFTRSVPGQPTLEGELRLGALDDLTSSTPVATPHAACAPRWVGAERLAYVTADDHLVVQDLDGGRPLDLTSRLRHAFGDASR